MLSLGLSASAAMPAAIKPTFGEIEPIETVEIDKVTNDIVQLEIITASDVFEFIPEIPDIEHYAGVKVIYTDYEDIIFPSDVAWRSSDENVFIIESNGAIQPTGLGKAYIIADYNGARAKKKISVEQGFIERIEFSPPELVIIQKGDVENLNEESVPEIFVLAYTASGNVYNITDNPNLTVVSTDSDLTVDELLRRTFPEGANVQEENNSHNSSIPIRSEIIESRDVNDFQDENNINDVYPNESDISSSKIEPKVIETRDIDRLQINTKSETGSIYAKPKAPANENTSKQKAKDTFIIASLNQDNRISTSLPVHILNADNIDRIEIVADDEIFAEYGGHIFAYAVFDNGVRVDITREASWESDNVNILDVINGFIVSSSAGSVTLTATYAGVSDSISINISEVSTDISYIPFP